MQNIKQYEVLQWASLFLKKYECEPKVAELLLQHHLNVSRTQFFAQMREPISDGVVQAFKRDVKKHVETGIPIQHLMGYEQFFGRHFYVNKHVLIPRFETEELVQRVIEHTRKTFVKNKPVTIVDVGTGSGVIAVTLALELDNAIVYATDISTEALAVAQQNAKQLGADVTFLEGDFLQPFIDEAQRAQIIVSNPPYIAMSERDELCDTVKNFDPPIALFADGNGLAAYQTIISQLPQAIAARGHLFFEIGHTQGRKVTSLLQESFPRSEVTIYKDMNKKDRIISCQLL
ncbi:MAG TPA: peptide chain release factor N(5)-glutamine methyltransferase [Bacillota bacterium]